MTNGGPLNWDGFWRDLYQSGQWEPETHKRLGLLDQGDLFVDIGAWIGPVSCWALERGATVIAVEPDPVAAAELRLRAPGAEIWEGAVALANGSGSITRNPKRGGMYGDSMSRLGKTGPKVATWTLPTILAGRVPRLVKVDIEGYEMELLPTLAPWLAERGASLLVSFHGGTPDPAWFAGYSRVAYPTDPWGDLEAHA